MKSRAEQLMEWRASNPPRITTSKGLSDYRKFALEQDIENGRYQETAFGNQHRMGDQNFQFSNYVLPSKLSDFAGDGPSIAGAITYSSNRKRIKNAAGGDAGAFTTDQSTSLNGANSGWRGMTSTTRQIPEVYSPLWLNSNLNLPRDRATINAWCRTFFALNPIVQNAITLHSTYPIAKLNIKCKDPQKEKFYAQMAEELQLMNICSQIAQEFWTLGECFVFAEYDERTAKWSRLLIQNPDYITVQRSTLAGEPIISLRPDENLRRMVNSNRPADIQQRRQLSKEIVDHVRKGENIPLNNFNISHLARRISPYEIRGTGLIVNSFRQLMLFDKLRESKFAQADNMINPLTLIKIGDVGKGFFPNPSDLQQWREIFECHDEETEVLTSEGFKKLEDVISYEEKMDGTFGTSHISNVSAKRGVKIACFNPETENLEYHEPSEAHIYNYHGEMIHFKNDKMDIKVTPNHDMWVQSKKFTGTGKDRTWKWGDWKKIPAGKLSDKLWDKRFRSSVKWDGDDSLKNVDVSGTQVPAELYLEMLGYVISEGCIYSDDNDAFVGIYQNTKLNNGSVNEHYPVMKQCVEKFSSIVNSRYCYEKCTPASIEKNTQEKWSFRIHSKEIFAHFKEQVGTDDGHKSMFKKVPNWVLNLSPRLLKILLNALVRGDGSDNPRENYYTSSKRLADDVYEIAYKCGYTPTMFVRDDDNYLYRYGKSQEARNKLYTVCWSNSEIGNYPITYKYNVDPRTKEKRNLVEKVHYNGKVWCFTVPTGLFVTRRNGKITIQGNSAQYDKDFKVFTHDGVSVERIGYAQGIYDISNDVQQLIKEIYIGLMVPSVVMDGSDTTYATGSVALDVLRQRYMQFRNMLSHFLKEKIFAPIAKLNDFYEYVDGVKTLIIPEIDWNHMSLFDMSDYIQNISNLAQGEGLAKKVSLQTLYRSLGLEYDDEMRKIRYEDIQDTIRSKELAALQQYPLNELRALGRDDEIDEVQEAPVPGENPYDEPDGGDMGGGMGGGMGGMPGGGGGSPLGLPPPPGGAPSAPIGGGGGRPPGTGSGPAGVPGPPGGGTGIGPGNIPKPPSPT